MTMLIITLMRKLVGQLKGKGTVAALTVFQKVLLGVTIITFGFDIFVSGVGSWQGFVVRVVKTGCWFSIIFNGMCHFTRISWELGIWFKKESSPQKCGKYTTTVPPNIATKVNNKRKNVTLERQNSDVKISKMALRVKKRLRTNMQLLMFCVYLGPSVYIWWPEGKDGFGCAPRVHTAIFTVRLILTTVGSLFAHAGFLHTIWVFKKKKKIAPANALARHGQSVRKMSILEHLHADQVTYPSAPVLLQKR
jgi:hypothetical protein